MQASLGFLEGGGEMGALTRNFDWEKTSLGKPENWPLSLKATVGILLHSAFPMFLFWGKDLLCFYNDAYRPSLGIDGKHPMLGKKAQEGWPDIWNFIGPLIEKVMSTGEPEWFEDQLLPIYRNGKMEDVFWTFSYNAAYGDSGLIEGVFVTCTETTRKVTALKELSESKNQLQFAIEATELGTWELNPKTNKFTGNARLKEWFGLKPDDEIELSLALNIIAEKDRAMVVEEIGKALTYESGGNYDIEYTIQNAITGKDIIVKAKGKAYFDEDKQPYTFSGTLQDVTEEATIKMQLAAEVLEQKLIREKVEESEAHLELLRNTVPAMIFYLDAEQRYRSYNGVFMQWFNINATEALGKTAREFIGEAAYRIVTPYLNKAYAGDQVRYEMHAPTRMNEEKWLSIVYTPDKNNEGTVVGVIAHATDITHSKETEISLRQSEARFRALIEEAPVATCVFTGSDLKIALANEMMLALWGKDKSVIGMPLKEALGNMNIQPFIDVLSNVYTTGQPYSEKGAKRELVINGVPGTYYFNLTYKPLYNEKGEVFAIIDMAMDVTEQMLVQKRTEESELFSRDVFYNSPVAKLVLTGSEMTIARVNENMLNMLGKNKSIIGKSLLEALPEFAATEAMAYLRNAFTTGQTFLLPEEKLESVRSGKPYRGYYNYIYKPLISASGEIYGIMITANEVTEQVTSRKTIEAKERELRELINASPIGICVLRGMEAKIEEVNDRFVIISGKNRERFENATYWEVFPEVAEAFAPILENVFKTGIKFTSEETEMVLIRRGKPETIYATFDYVPVINNNEVTKVIVIVIEVSHQVETRKLVEEAVVARTKELAETNISLKRSNEELEQFAYIASHDLQEPIRKIRIFLEMLEDSLPVVSDKSKEYIEKITSSTERMTKLIRDVLAFSQINQNTKAFEKVDLNKIIQTVESDFELLITQANAVIEISDLPVINAIPSQMVQLFGNLLSNSLKYKRPDVDPLITISASVATREQVEKHPQLFPNRKYHHLVFRDNGIGFAPEYADRIFKIFQRLHSKSEFEGTGIGLSVCRKVVQSHKGHISAAPGENGGAVINIILPVDTPE